jgi:hypothetical protein
VGLGSTPHISILWAAISIALQIGITLLPSHHQGERDMRSGKWYYAYYTLDWILVQTNVYTACILIGNVSAFASVFPRPMVLVWLLFVFVVVVVVYMTSFEKVTTNTGVLEGK